MKFEIKHRYNNSVLFSGEFGSLRLCVEAAVSSKTNLNYASLDRARLDGASLVGASLDGARLVGASLDRASLDGASLVTVGWIGSRKAYTTYNATKDEVRCGCFAGTMKEFKAKVKATYPAASLHRKEYEAAIKFMEAVAKARKS